MGAWVDDWNLIEAALWFGCAAVMGVRALWPRCQQRRICVALALTLLVFGASDLIEAQTGTWWQPWWLAVLKAGCVAAMAICFRKLLSGPRAQAPPATPRSSDPARRSARCRENQ